jgi:hypothetical protein
MAATATILKLVSVDYLTNAWVFSGLLGVDWREVPFDDQRHRSFKMAAMLDLVSIDSLSNPLGRLV